MRKIPWFFHVGLIALVPLVYLASCSGGCGTCTVPPYHPGVVVPGVTPTPLPPGVTPTPVPPTPTPTPVPIPPAAACTQGAPNSIALGDAAPFALLGGAGITNTGNTFVNFATGAVSTNVFGTFNDDLVGAYPTTTITGFTGANDQGGATVIYATGYNSNAAFLTAAQAAVTNAYTLATAVHAGTITFPDGQDLSQASSGVANCGPAGNAACGVGTLGAGVYFSASTMSITAGALTLDGGGNPAAVFIFQIGSALTMAAPGGNVILVNGANPCNIYWADFSGATLGGVATGAHFYGNLIAPTGALVFTTAITLFEGRALGGTPTAVNISAPTTGLSIINFGGD
ncbi:MAG: ice-binding family protein [Vulcanimicrobiaceae bacterium]|jgi:hypothetical protein